MSAHPPFEICHHCGVRVGVYEPARIQLSDGTIVAASVLGIGKERRREVVRVWHRTCLDAETEEPAR
jgi:hypothetical protein